MFIHMKILFYIFDKKLNALLRSRNCWYACLRIYVFVCGLSLAHKTVAEVSYFRPIKYMLSFSRC